VRASAGEELSLLVNLLRNDTIGYRMLLRNVVEIVLDDNSLVVDAVRLIADRERAVASSVDQDDYEDALVAIRCSDQFSGKEVLISSVSDAMQQSW